MAKLRWGLIGASTIAAERMIGAFRANGVEAVTVMSTNADRAASHAKKHGIAHATTSPEELVDSKDVEAVHISTTNDLLRDQVFAAGGARKHVLCEKPLVLTLTDARAMVAECRKRGGVTGPITTSATRRRTAPCGRQSLRAGSASRCLPGAAGHSRHHRSRRRHTSLSPQRRALIARGQLRTAAWAARDWKTALWA